MLNNRENTKVQYHDNCSNRTAPHNHITTQNVRLSFCILCRRANGFGGKIDTIALEVKL